MSGTDQAEELFHRWNDLSFSIEVSARYHRRRAQFLGQFDRMVKLTGIAAGSALFAKTAGIESPLFIGIGLCAVVFGLGVFVFRVADRVTEHTEAMRSFLNLQDELSNIDRHDCSSEQLRKIEASRRAIESKMVHEVEALAHLCYNETARARGRPERVKINFLQEKLAQFLTFQRSFPPILVN